MAKLNQAVLSDRLTSDGRWAEWLNGIMFRVRPITHPEFQDALTKSRAPYRSVIAAAPDDPKVGEILLRTVEENVHLLVTDCGNIEDDDGAPIEFSREWIIETLKREDMDHLRGWIIATASQSAAYTKAGEAMDSGNSRRLSAGG